MKNRKLNHYTSLMALAVFSLFTYACGDDDTEAPNEPPVALFAASPSSATVGDEITFTDQSGDSDGEISSWSWDFGDGEASSEQNPTHIYASSGDFEVTLEVSDSEGEKGTYSLTVSIDQFSELWVEKIGSASISPSAPAEGSDGTLYFGSQDNNVYAVNPADGSIKWTYTTGNRVRSRAAVGSDGTIYIPSQDKKIYALNADGTLKWDFETGGSIFNASPALGTDGTIYIGSDDKKLHALNSDGTEKWSFDVGGNIRSDAVIGATGIIYVASQDGKLYALNTSGSEQWQFEASTVINASPAIGSDGTIYIADDGGKLYAVNPDGSQKWVFTTADNNPFQGSPIIGEDGTIYIGTKRGPTTDTGLFYAINSSGSEVWKFEMPKGDETAGSDQYYQNDILGTPTVGNDGTIYSTFNDGKLYAFNNDGTVKFTYKVTDDLNTERWDQAIWTSPLLTEDGKLFFQDYSGNVYALQVSASGLANSAWPTRGKNNQRVSR